MTRDKEAFEAGRQYGKQYRRTHRTWSSETSIARRAMERISGTYDMVGFFYGVLEGLRPFASQDFAATFDRNAEAATYKAEALLGRVRLQVMSQDVAHYQATLAYWEQLGARQCKHLTDDKVTLEAS